MAGRAMRNVLILGCGRSGTSITGELFEALPHWTYLSEPHLVDIPTGATRLAVKVPRPSADDPSSPVDLPAVLYRLADPVVVWQVRHPLDAVCSLRPGIAAGWDHHPRPPDWRSWLDRPLPERCAHHWATVNGAGFDAVPVDVVVSRFEDQIADPAGHARRLVDVAGVDPETVQPELLGWARRVQDTDNEHFVEARTSRRHSRPDHSVRVGRWRENLDASDLAAIIPIVAAGAARFGYQLPGSAQPNVAR